MEIVINGAKVYLDTRTTSKWAECEQEIPKGFPCVELADDDTIKFKVGDGTHTYDQLPYIGADVDLSEYSNTEQMKQAIEAAISEAFSKKGDLFTLKGTVETTDELPDAEGTEGTNSRGDVYLVGEEGGDDFAEYYWTGEKWEYMGTTTSVDLSNYYTKGQIDEKLADCIHKDDVLILNCSLPEEE